MKLFLKTLFLFALIWFALAGVSDCYVTTNIRHADINDFAPWENILNSQINADILFLGSSRTTHSYYPIVFDSILHTNSYNLGMYGKLIDMDLLCYNLYKETNCRPSLIVWDLYQSTFGYSGQYKDYQFAPYLSNRIIWQSIHNEHHSYNYIDKYVPLYRYWKNPWIFNWIFSPPIQDYYYKGFIIDTTRWWFSDGLDSIEDYSIDCNYSQDLIAQFESTIDEMQSDGIKVVLVFSPFHIDGQRKVKDLDKYVAFIDSIAHKHNCTFLNYLSDSISYDKSLYHNTEHLDYYGASLFSTKLAHALDSIINSSD